MRPGWWLALVLAVTLPTFGASVNAESGDYLRFDFAGATERFGPVTATCLGAAYLEAPSTTVRLSGALEIITTHWNETNLHPGGPNETRIQPTYQQSTEKIPMQDDQYVVRVRDGGRLRIFSENWPQGSEWADLRIVGNNLTTGIAVTQVSDEEYFVDHGLNVARTIGGLPGPTRKTVVDDLHGVSAHGAITMFIQNATIEGVGTHLDLPPRSIRPITQNELIDVVQYSEVHALIRGALTLVEAPEWSFACASLDGSLNGSYTGFHARGTGKVGNTSTRIQNQDITAEGNLHFSERTRDDWTTRGNLEGEFSLVALDYRAVTAPTPDSPAMIVVAVGGLGLILVVAFFYSRFQASKALDHTKRMLVHLTIRENPGIRPAGIQKKTGLPEGTLRYHLEQLVRHGLVQRTTHARGTRYMVSSSGDARTSPMPLDEVEAFVRAQCAAQRTLVEVHKTMVETLGYKPSRAWYTLKRMIDTGAVRAEKINRRTWIQWVE